MRQVRPAALDVPLHHPIDVLADVAELRAFTATMALDLDCSPVTILETMISVFKHEQQRRADDLFEMVSMGRVLEVAELEHRRLHEPPEPSEARCG